MYIYLYCNIIPTAPNKALDAVSIMSYNSPKRALCKITCLSDTIVSSHTGQYKLYL